MLAQLQENYPEQVRIVFRHLPLIGTPDRPFHDKAALSAQAAEAAGKQDMFWEMHDLLFAKQSEWVDMTPEQFQEWLVEQAAELDLDEEQFTTDLTSPEVEAIAQEAWDHAQTTGMVYTPLLLVNNQLWPNNLPISYENLSAITELEMLQARQFTDCPPMVIDTGKEYVATLHTEKGDIVLELYAAQAPLAVNNFVFLAREGWYDGVTFHRVLPGFVAQAGDPTGTGYGGPGYAFKNEISPDLNFQEPGVLAMANSGPDTNGSQFFITTGATPNLEGGYTIFGQVIEGMDVVESLSPRDPSQSMNLPPGDVIESVTIEER